MKLKSIALCLALPIIFGFGSCATTGTNFYYDNDGKYVEIVEPAEQCVLYRVLGDTMAYKQGLFIMNYTAIKAGIYSAEDALRELDTIQAEVARPGATVGSVINTLMIIASKAAKVGAPEMVLLTEGLAPFETDMTPIDDCTRYKLLAYIGSQRNLAIAFGN